MRRDRSTILNRAERVRDLRPIIRRNRVTAERAGALDLSATLLGRARRQFWEKSLYRAFHHARRDADG